MVTEPPPRGMIERLTDLAHPGLDVSLVHPAVAAFFEDTAGLELLVRSRWHFPFSVAWRMLRPLMRALGQFALPLAEARIKSRVACLDSAKDGRPGARGVVRSYVHGGEVMQVIAYATWTRATSSFLSAAIPLPGGQLAGLLRLDPTDEDDQNRVAVALTSVSRNADDAGVWMVLGRVAFRSPFTERLALWPPGMKGAPPELDPAVFPGTSLVGEHEQRIFGVRFATHRYWFRPTREGG